ncbi:hypothetical protein KF840_23695 [bacterium]|nr:hypothetical protein [bacterium]
MVHQSHRATATDQRGPRLPQHAHDAYAEAHPAPVVAAPAPSHDEAFARLGIELTRESTRSGKDAVGMIGNTYAHLPSSAL